ncbi:MAG: aconitate hydratase AcnA [Solirubrobacteraceae bacterium]
MSANSFGAKSTLEVGGRTYEIYRIDALQSKFDVARLPFSLKILLENLLRNEDGRMVHASDIEALASWNAKAEQTQEIGFTPARVVMQDFTGVPAIVDLAAMRDAIKAMGGEPKKINPLVPAEMVIDHSVQVDEFGTSTAFQRNAELEFERNRERYSFLRWGQTAFDNFKVVPPDTGIVHQVNLEYLARVVFVNDPGAGGVAQAYPDTLVGTDSHTTMVNGLGVLGWGVGGIEAEAAMLGQAMSMLLPQVIGFRLHGQLPEGATATDLVLTVTELLRKHGVVGKFVEFIGSGVANTPLADRATIGNMSPEFGSTCAIFPIDSETLRYLELSGRPSEQIELVQAYAKANGLWHDADSEQATYTEVLELDLATVVPSISGPRRPQDRVPLRDSRQAFQTAVRNYLPTPDDGGQSPEGSATARPSVGNGSVSTAQRLTLADGTQTELDHGHVVIAAITSCTNTSNPSVLVAAGLLARNAVQRGLKVKPWVKTSLAPGSKVVTEYLNRAGLTEYLDTLGFNLVGYGCTTCIGNSGPLPAEISKVIADEDLAVVSVLSGNRNFEGRINPDVKMNYLASPPLCVAYALAGTMDIDLYTDPLGQDQQGQDVYLKDVWPSSGEIADVVAAAVKSDMFRNSYADVFDGDARWQSLPVPTGELYDWDDRSTYVRQPPFFEHLPVQPEPLQDIVDGRVLAVLGDSVTTDHISPAGSIKQGGPAAQYLNANHVEAADFNSFGSRRGNHEVMMRGTFANIRLRNRLAPGTEGGVTLYLADGTATETSIYEAAMRYMQQGIPLIVLAGKEYGSGSSRDWAAKGTRLLGVRAVIAESFERIHRNNLVGMGVLPLQFQAGESVETLGLTGHEKITIPGIAGGADLPRTLTVHADEREFTVTVRIDTPMEQVYYRHGGILQYVLRQLLAA